MAKQTITIRMEPRVWEEIKKAAAEENRSANNWLETVAIEALKKRAENSKPQKKQHGKEEPYEEDS